MSLRLNTRVVREDKSRAEERDKFSREAITYIDHLYRMAFHVVKEKEEAQDMVQETYVQALGAYKQFTPGTNMKARLTKILYNFFSIIFTTRRSGFQSKIKSGRGMRGRIIGKKCPQKTRARKAISYLGSKASKARRHHVKSRRSFVCRSSW